MSRLGAVLTIVVCCVAAAVWLIRGGTWSKGGDESAIAAYSTAHDPADMSQLERETVELVAAATPAPRADIVVFDDFECQACQRFAAGPLAVVRRMFDKTVTVRVLPFPLPYHHAARRLALVGECAARQGRFAALHDWIYLSPLRQAMAVYDTLPYSDIGLDEQELKVCLDGVQVSRGLDRKILLAERLGVHATPTVIVNGMWLDQVPDSATLVRAIKGP